MNPPLNPTPAMIEAGAQRLVNWQDDTVWPDSFDEQELMMYRRLAEKCWREMWMNHALEQQTEGLKKRLSVKGEVESND